VLQDPRTASRLGEALAAHARPWGPTAALSPALGGVVIGHEVARALGVRAVFAERQDARLTLRRGFTLSSTDRVLIVEDVVTTGLSTRETIEVARAAGAEVVGAVSLIDRSGGRAALGVPYAALAALDLPTWTAEACPLCASGVAVIKPGSRPTQA
jgi:orotate phosphoribosyltransferase